jgi:hypothetical protein
VADEVLVAKAVEKIIDGDVVLTYASSSVVQAILVTAHMVRASPRERPPGAGCSQPLASHACVSQSLLS